MSTCERQIVDFSPERVPCGEVADSAGRFRETRLERTLALLGRWLVGS